MSHFSRARSCRAIIWIGLSLSVAESGCSLGKRADATDPARTELIKKFASSLTALDASNLARDNTQVIKYRMIDLFPGITAHSASGGVYNPDQGATIDLFNDQDWEPNEASGIAAAFGAESRPTDPVALTYWKGRVYPACDWYLGKSAAPDEAAAGAIFSKADVLMDGETLPDVKKDPGTYWGFLAARNGFLYPYPADSVEVKALADLYTTTLSNPNVNTSAWKTADGNYSENRSPEQLARLAVCVAALSAPQFMLGNASKIDVIRKLAYTLGYRRPTFKEISDFSSGKLDLRAWVAGLQQTEGYFAAMGRWHQDWLGLRPYNNRWSYFLPDGRTVNLPFGGSPGAGSQVADPRLNWGGPALIQPASFSLVSSDYYLTFPFHFGINKNAAPPDAPKLALSFGTPAVAETLEPLTSEAGTYLNSLQEFDPRTAIVSYEFASCPATGQYVPDSNYAPKVVYVLKSAYDSQLANLKKTLPGFPFDATHCKASEPAQTYDDVTAHPPNTATESDYTAGGLFPSYYLCRSDDSANYTTQPLTFGLNGHFFTSVDATLMPDRGEVAIYYGCNGQYLSPAQLARPVFRIRRFSPVVTANGTYSDQNGLSTVHTWFAGEAVLASNTLQRFLLTCAFRPGPEFEGFKPLWFHAADYYNKYLGDFVAPTSHFTQDMNMASNPYFLNQFRCGKPVLAALNTPTLTQAVNDSAFPFAYSHAPKTYPTGAVSATALNSLINVGGLNWYTGMTSTPNPLIAADSPTAAARFNAHLASNQDEAGAIIRLQKQLQDEPLNLVRYILKNHLSYKELLTARYTVGGPELELYYRTQGYFLPDYPDPEAAKAAKAGASYLPPSQHYKIELSQYTSLRANYLHPAVQSTADGDLPQNPANGTTYYMNATDAPQYAFSQNAKLPPRAGAGILTMPAFLSPMAVQDVKLRSVSHRIFVRFLCGEPNVVVLSGAEQSTHNKYLQSPKNPTDAAHLNSSTTCYQCHINMDPLSAALGFNFLDTVLTEYETPGSMGELYAPSELLNQFQFGVRSGPFRGTGAFLGKEIKPDPGSSGFQQVGEILANDDRFARCLTTRVFQKLFGRAPTFSEVGILNDARKHFMADDGDFSVLIQDLALSSAYDKDN